MKRSHKTQKKSSFHQIKIVSASDVSPKVYFAACVAEAIRSNAQRAKENEANRLRFDRLIQEHYNDINKEILRKRVESDKKGKKS